MGDNIGRGERMEDIKSILNRFQAKKKDSSENLSKAKIGPHSEASFSEIPDVFFDEILQQFKLSRAEILVLTFLYRQVYCRPNLYKSHGIGPLNAYTELASSLSLSMDELTLTLRSLENYGFIETVRAGQYFVRKYFTEKLDLKFGQDYDEFF